MINEKSNTTHHSTLTLYGVKGQHPVELFSVPDSPSAAAAFRKAMALHNGQFDAFSVSDEQGANFPEMLTHFDTPTTKQVTSPLFGAHDVDLFDILDSLTYHNTPGQPEPEALKASHPNEIVLKGIYLSPETHFVDGKTKAIQPYITATLKNEALLRAQAVAKGRFGVEDASHIYPASLTISRYSSGGAYLSYSLPSSNDYPNTDYPLASLLPSSNDYPNTDYPLASLSQAQFERIVSLLNANVYTPQLIAQMPGLGYIDKLDTPRFALSYKGMSNHIVSGTVSEQQCRWPESLPQPRDHLMITQATAGKTLTSVAAIVPRDTDKGYSSQRGQHKNEFIYIPLYSARELHNFLHEKRNVNQFDLLDVSALRAKLTNDGYYVNQYREQPNASLALSAIDKELPGFIKLLNDSPLERGQQRDMLLSALKELPIHLSLQTSSQIAQELVDGARDSIPLQPVVFAHGNVAPDYTDNAFSLTEATQRQSQQIKRR